MDMMRHLVDEFVPRFAAVIEVIVVGFEDAIRQPVVTHELPDVLDGIELRTLGGQRQERHVGRDFEFCRSMPSGLIEQQDRVTAGSDVLGDFGQVQVHRLAVAERKDEPDAFAIFRANRAEYVGRSGALIAGPSAARDRRHPAINAPLRPTYSANQTSMSSLATSFSHAIFSTW